MTKTAPCQSRPHTGWVPLELRLRQATAGPQLLLTIPPAPLGPGHPKRQARSLHTSRSLDTTLEEKEHRGQPDPPSVAVPARAQPPHPVFPRACSSQIPYKVGGTTTPLYKEEGETRGVREPAPGQAGEQQLRLGAELSVRSPLPAPSTHFRSSGHSRVTSDTRVELSALGPAFGTLL